MKPLQMWGFVIVALIMVFVVTFLSQSVSRHSKQTASIGGASTTETTLGLTFPKSDVDDASLVEMKPSTGHYDFFFENTNAIPINIGIDRVSCKCSKVEMLLLAKEEESAYQNWLATGATQVGLTANGALPQALASTEVIVHSNRNILGHSDRWQSLMETEENPLLVPAHCKGLVRLSWEGKEPGMQRLKAVVWHQEPGQAKTRSYTSLEMPIQFVQPLLIEPPTADVKEISAGSQRTVNFIVWSPTRAGFSFMAKEEGSDPCFECTFTPMTRAECDAAMASAPAKTLFMYSGGRLSVTVHERVAGRQMDIGPFARKITVASDALPHPINLEVQGIVLGEVRILSDDKSRINLGPFSADAGATTVFKLESDRSDLKLQHESHVPEYLEVELAEAKEPASGGAKTWEMRVTVPRNRAVGRLPSESMIVLKTQDNPPRRFRIPVVGHATIK